MYASTIEIAQPEELVIDPAVTGTLGNDGTATALVSGGTTPYTYLWENGQTSAGISGLSMGAYSVTVTDAHGCTSEAIANVGVPTATKDIDGLLQLLISPNPGNGLFRLQVDLATAKTMRYKVFDLQGIELFESDAERSSQLDQMIDLQRQASGVYIVVLDVEGELVTRKLVVLE